METDAVNIRYIAIKKASKKRPEESGQKGNTKSQKKEMKTSRQAVVFTGRGKSRSSDGGFAIAINRSE